MSQTAEQVAVKSDGCYSCHTKTDEPSMHATPAVMLGCVDCHGGNVAITMNRTPHFGRIGGNVFFAATGITDGDLVKGVKYRGDDAITQSLVMRSKSGTVRRIDAIHRLHKLREFAAVDFG